MPEEQRQQHGAISESSTDDASVQAKIQNFVDNERFRKHIIEIIDEHTDSAVFMKKIHDSFVDELESTYTSKRFEEFQKKVQEINLAQLGTDKAHDVLKPYINDRVEEILRNRAWKNKNFLVPTLISLVATVAAVIALFK
jgi:benzoyl-CoA reductase/2-hydroxyglutaryl-CoA dehydratase subunit BcrC/BadD/HgdB